MSKDQRLDLKEYVEDLLPSVMHTIWASERWRKWQVFVGAEDGNGRGEGLQSINQSTSLLSAVSKCKIYDS